jgi:hypothetical protein
MAVLDSTALQQILKVQYTQKKVNNLCYPESPLFAKMRKTTNFGGKVEHVAFQYGSPQGRGFVFANGLANMTASAYSGLDLTRKTDYAFAQITGEMVDAAKAGDYALLDGMKREIDNAFYTVARSIAASLFGNSGGARGQLAAGAAVGTPTVLLADINQVVNFEVGMVLNLAATDGTSGAKRAGTVTLTAINRDTGALTASGNWTAGIAAAAAGDYIFQNGDFESTKSGISGVAAWIPSTAPTAGDNFFGLDRSVDPVRLAGVRYTANAGGPIEETLVKASARLVREGGKPDVVVMHPFDWANLVVALGSKVIINDEKLPDADVGMKSIKIWGAKGPMDVIADPNCPTGVFYMLTLSTWRFHTLMSAPRVLNADGNQMLRDATSDSYIIRIGYYGNVVCDAPGWNLYGTL